MSPEKVQVVSERAYYAALSSESDADFCPHCAHVTDVGWGNTEYCPKCGWNTITERTDHA